MKGLFRKELLFYKTYWLYFLIVFILVLLISGFHEGSVILPFVWLTMISFLSLLFSQYSNWNSYAITCSISRKKIVQSRYLTGLLCFLISIALSLLLLGLYYLFISGFHVQDAFAYLSFSIFITTIYHFVLYPIFYLKNKIITTTFFGIYAFLMGVLVVLNPQKIIFTMKPFQVIVNLVQKVGYPYLYGFMIVICTCSYIISQIIFKKKDL